MRSGTLEMQELQGVDEGLEKWTVKLEEKFPIPRDVFEDEILPLMGINMSLRQDEFDQEEVLDKIATQSPDLVAVHLHLRKSVFEMDGCQAEYAEMLVNGAFIRSIGIGSQDISKLLALRSSLGLENLENTSYLAAFKKITGMVPLNKLDSLPEKTS